MGYRIEWLADNDKSPETWGNDQFLNILDEDDISEISALENGEEWESDPAIAWQGSTAGNYTYEAALGHVTSWQVPGCGSWSISRIIDNDTGETVWESWTDHPTPDEEGEGGGPYMIRAAHRTEKGMGIDSYDDKFTTVAEAQAFVTDGWDHQGWELQVVNSSGEIVARSVHTGDAISNHTWLMEEAAAVGEGPRDGESFGDYLTRLRAREDNAEVL